jgi:hypothetical protein
VAEGPDDETPFAPVPAPGAGPLPTQVGPFTYDKVAASIGRSGFRPAKQSPIVLAALIILAVAFVALLILTVAGVLA